MPLHTQRADKGDELFLLVSTVIQQFRILTSSLVTLNLTESVVLRCEEGNILCGSLHL